MERIEGTPGEETGWSEAQARGVKPYWAAFCVTTVGCVGLDGSERVWISTSAG